VYVSAASAWEAAIKSALGRLDLADSFETMTQANGFEPLPIVFRHADWLRTLPPHHADPFDRMLIAQAQAERLTLVTHDRVFERYDILIVWT
jgi:PIN domain nuclease of toxin-antitoxin system